MFLEIIIGLQCAMLLVLITLKWHPQKQLKLWSNSLIIAALIYLGFLINKQAWGSLPTEGIGILFYSTLAIIGYRHSPYFLIIGWILHMLWDLLLHYPDSAIAPNWYPGICFGFDMAIAAYLCYLIWSNRFKTPTINKTSTP